MSKNNNIASQALLEMEAIKDAIKEESKKTLKSLLAEQVKNAIRESIDEEDEEPEIEDENENEKETSQKDNKMSSNEKSGSMEEDENGAEMEDAQIPADNAMEPAEGEEPVADASEAPEAAEEPVEGEGNDEWANYSQYQAGDDENTYDLTGAQDFNDVVKVYKLLKKDDDVIVSREGDTIHLQDNSNDTEYVLELGGDGENPEAAEVEGEGEEEMPMNNGEELNEMNLAGFNDDDDLELSFDNEDEFEGEPEDDEFEIANEPEDDEFNLDDEFEDDEFESEPAEELGFNDDADEGMYNENKKTRKAMKENKEQMFEVDLGYTDNYQDVDPIEGLSNDEPSKSGKSWHKGVPTGTKKPWAGQSKTKGEPFNKSVNEEEAEEVSIEEGAMSKARANRKRANMTRSEEIGDSAYNPEGTKMDTSLKESLKKLQKENKELKECVLALKKSLTESYVTSVSLGKATKLFLENTTSQAEKIEIINRLSEAKTIEQSNALYESISRELKKGNNSLTENKNNAMTITENKNLTESKKYMQQGLIDTLDLIRRVENC